MRESQYPWALQRPTFRLYKEFYAFYFSNNEPIANTSSGLGRLSRVSKIRVANIEILPTTLQEEGYTIKKLHTSGNCYEIYGKNKVGKHVEIYFDTKTYAIIKAEIEK